MSFSASGRPPALSERLVARGPTGPVARSLERFRRQVGDSATAAVSSGFFHGLSSVARLHPLARPERHHVEVIRDVRYADGDAPEHVLDIYRPTVRPGPWPVVLYVHGGGFRLLSKDTHWLMGLVFARFGYLVLNISYRLAPRHPYPAAIADTCAAYQWMVANAEAYGGDLDRIVVAGESAGANLVTALSVAATYRRDEPWARAVFDTGRVPSVAIPACGILQVTDVERFARRRKLPRWVRTVIGGVSQSYVGGTAAGDLDLADPLVVLERGEPPARPLPAFFVPVGTRDPLLPDTRRLERAVRAHGAPCEARYYPGELHAFHALIWRKQARRCWRDTLAFLERHLRAARGPDRVGDLARAVAG
jgi:acetyl esterase